VILKNAASTVEGKISGIEGRVGTPGTPANPNTPPLESGLLHTMVLRSIGSLYAVFLEVTFVPFLVFFMLSEKQEVWHSTLQLFPVSRRTAVKETLEDLRDVLRDYLVQHKIEAADALVFGRADGTPFATSTISKRANDGWREAQLRPITLHECRHTFASLMIAASVNPKALQTFMGHSSITVTLCSGGVRAARSGSAATGMAARLNMKGNACSSPQNEISNRGLIRTISAIINPAG